MQRFTVTFEVEDAAPAPAIFQNAWKAFWAKDAAAMIGEARVVAVSMPQPYVEEADA